MSDDRYLTFALGKGRLAKKTLQLFEQIGESSTDSYPMKCYELVAAKSKSEQEHLYKMLVEMDKYKNQ